MTVKEEQITPAKIIILINNTQAEISKYDFEINKLKQENKNRRRWLKIYLEALKKAEAKELK